MGTRGIDNMGRFVANRYCATVADSVLIATPDRWHSPVAVGALAAGRDSYVDKPSSNTIAAAQRIGREISAVINTPVSPMRAARVRTA